MRYRVLFCLSLSVPMLALLPASAAEQETSQEKRGRAVQAQVYTDIEPDDPWLGALNGLLGMEGHGHLRFASGTPDPEQPILRELTLMEWDADGLLQSSREIVVLQQDAVLQGLMPTLDLALCLRVVRRAPDMIHVLVIKPFSQLARDIGRAVVAEQPRLVNDGRRITA